MTSSELDQGGKLCQIGAAVIVDGKLHTFCEDIGWTPGCFYWEQRSLDVCGFDLARVHAGPRADEVDERLAAWLRSFGAKVNKRASTVPVGWNVNGFDMPYIKAQLPKTHALLSRRCVDLNAAAYLAQEVAVDGNEVKDHAFWKQQSWEYADKQLPGDWARHNAGVDAAAALYEQEYFERLFRGSFKTGK